MDLLLDSHIALWWAADPSLIEPVARQAIENPANTVFASAASVWELSIKVASGKLVVDVRALVNGLAGQGVRLLGIGIDAAIRAPALDWDHRDPFDRMLVAQAQQSLLTLLTRDRTILDFAGAKTLEA